VHPVERLIEEAYDAEVLKEEQNENTTWGR
jgi:hypothetical protein